VLNSALTSPPGSFPWTVLHDRHPALIAKVLDGLPYSPDRHQAVAELAEEITGVIQPLLPSAHDVSVWARWGGDYFGRSWYDVPFLWAESFFYRKLLGAVGYFGPGPWQGVDPFEPVKSAELTGDALSEELAALGGLPVEERTEGLLAASLWGNQADLGFRLQQKDDGRASALVVDDSAALSPLLTGTVCVVADNAGRELVPDLLLADHLLDTGADRILLHVKAYPYFTSDATMSDVLACLRRLAVEDAGPRLWQAVRDGRLSIAAHPFSVAPWSYHDMPADLAEDFAAASVTIMKGDLNYRRLVGDRAWPADTPFRTVTEYFPGPVAAVRTLKSDVVVGVPDDVLADLESSGEPWRTNGAHALIQVAH
jgi:damage control phosphatase ARMT1-like protein